MEHVQFRGAQRNNVIVEIANVQTAIVRTSSSEIQSQGPHIVIASRYRHVK